jgi:hypothetical protein
MFAALKRKQQQQSNSHRSQPQLTLNRFFDEHYFPHVRATKRSTKDTWSTYNIHLREQFGRYRLDELSNPLFDVWVREQIVAGYQRSTINKHIFLVNRMLNLARHWGYIERSKELSNIQRLVLGDYKQRFLSEAEIAAILKHVSTQ